MSTVGPGTDGGSDATRPHALEKIMWYFWVSLYSLAIIVSLVILWEKCRALYWAIFIIVIILFIIGCADNRVRIKPSIQPINDPVLRLEVMRRLYNELALQKAEEYYEVGNH